MSEGWNEEEWDEVHSGLARLGWHFDSGVTNEDSPALLRIAERANRLCETDSGFETNLESLAIEAYEILGFYVMEVGERAARFTGPYLESEYLPEIIPLLDEAALAYYRGYYTASFAVLLISLERYLRLLLVGTPLRRDPSFADLRKAVSRFEESGYRSSAELVMKGLYSRYDFVTPTRFYFNRHGILHGIREPLIIDSLNSCRMFQLFDLLLGAETGRIGRYMDDRAAFDRRYNAFLACQKSAAERELLVKA